MKVALGVGQRTELQTAAKTDGTPSVRVKALAILNLADGRTATDVAAIFRTSRQSLAEWLRAYQREGIAGLRVKPGRGRRRRADPAQIEQYVRQSPRSFGVALTRWTLATLGNTVPCLKGFTVPGVRQALRRAGFRYKRGQPTMHSPDPEYGQKKGLWIKV